MAREPTVLTTLAVAMADALTVRKIDGTKLLAEAGLDLRALGDPNARYTVAATSRAWRLAVEAPADPAFGLEVARHVHPTTFHALGFSVLSSQTLRDPLERIARSSRI